MGRKEADSQPGAEGFRARGRFWIEGPEGTFLGYGRVILLERIRDHGSISAAARSMEMSYRHAWQLVDSMNRQSKTPVVAKSTGGKGGGGAVLTEAGERAIELFWPAYAEFKEHLARQTARLRF
jgi:molybdate transport system regulatory protein